ncbi:hypothetical protein PMAYCL1PPCAC_23064, partial [Pristionchus mayeri]
AAAAAAQGGAPTGGAAGNRNTKKRPLSSFGESSQQQQTHAYPMGKSMKIDHNGISMTTVPAPWMQMDMDMKSPGIKHEPRFHPSFPSPSDMSGFSPESGYYDDYYNPQATFAAGSPSSMMLQQAQQQPPACMLQLQQQEQQRHPLVMAQQQHPMGFFYGHHPPHHQQLPSVGTPMQLQQQLQQQLPSGSSPINGATVPAAPAPGQPEDDLHSLSSDTSGHFSSGASTSSRGDMTTPPRMSTSSTQLTPMNSSSSSSASSSTPDSAPSRNNNNGMRLSGGMDEAALVTGHQAFFPHHDELLPTIDFMGATPWESIWSQHLTNTAAFSD